MVKGLRRIQYGVPKAYAHQSLWHAIYAMRHKIAQVSWAKAHMTPEEAIARGYTLEQVQGNDKADELAKNKKAGTCIPTRGTSNRSTHTDFE